MRRILISMIVLIALMACMAGYAEVYPKVFVVDSVDTEADTMMLVDMVGFMWEAEGVEDYLPGDCVGAIMEDHGTPEIFDDEIVTIRYCGWFDGEWGEID